MAIKISEIRSVEEFRIGDLVFEVGKKKFYRGRKSFPMIAALVRTVRETAHGEFLVQLSEMDGDNYPITVYVGRDTSGEFDSLAFTYYRVIEEKD